MRTITIIAVVLLVIAGLAFGIIPGLWMHAKQAPKDIAGVINRSASDEHIASIYGEKLNEAEDGLRDYYCDVYRAKAEMAKVESALNVQKQELVKKEQIIRRVQELLEKNKPDSAISVGGVSFSWEQINQDALNHLSTCQILRKQIAGNEQSLSKLRQAYESGVKVISEKQEELRRKKLEFKVEKVELVALRAQQEVDAIVGKVYQVKTADLGIARKMFDDRINILRAKAEYDEQVGLRKTTTIPWDKEFGISESASDGIGSYFSEGEIQATE